MISTRISLHLAIVWGCFVFSVCALEFTDIDPNQSNGNVGMSTPSPVWEFDDKDTITNGFRVGTVQILNPQNYTLTALCQPQQWTISDHKAAALWLEFDSITLPSDDQLVLVPTNGSEVPIDVSSATSAVVSSIITGNTVQLQYRPSPSCSPSSSGNFSLNRLGIKYTKDWMVQKEAICGSTDSMKNAVCFANNGDATDAIMYQKSQAVLRTEYTRPDGAIVVCTAWLWGTQGHMITNNHCFSNQAMVDATSFMFGSEMASCNGKCAPGSCPASFIVKGGNERVKFIASDPILDIAVLQLTSDVEAILSRFGYLQIRFGYPSKGEAIYIPQHPLGGARKIAKTDDDTDTSIATIKELNQSIKIGDKTFTDLIGYAADTESGSSGSPVISRLNHQVIGLHRIGNCNNAATPSQQLLGFLSPLTTDVHAFIA